MRISDWSSDVCSSDLSAFLGAQLGIAGETLAAYAVRRQTRHQHMEALRRIYGYRMFPGRGPYARALRDWRLAEAEQGRANDELARRLIVSCRERQTHTTAHHTSEGRRWDTDRDVRRTKE